MAESARTKSGSAISAPRAGTARDRTWRLRLLEAGRLVSGTAPIVDQGPRLGSPHDQVEDEVEDEVAVGVVDVTEAMHRRDCPGGSHNYSNPGKVLEG